MRENAQDRQVLHTMSWIYSKNILFLLTQKEYDMNQIQIIRNNNFKWIGIYKLKYYDEIFVTNEMYRNHTIGNLEV